MTGNAARIIGAVDYFDPKLIKGWAANVRQPDTPISMQLIVSDTVVLEWENNINRPDVAASLKTSNAYGFEIDVSEFEIKDPTSVQVRVKDTATALDLPQQWSAHRVYIERATPDTISGWAWNPFDTQEHVRLRIFFEGDELGITTANIYRKDLEKAGIGSGDHAFVLKLPRSNSRPIPLEAISAEPIPKPRPAPVEAPAPNDAEAKPLIPSIASDPAALSKSSVAPLTEVQLAPRSLVPAEQKIDWRELAFQFFDAAWYESQALETAVGSKSLFDHWWDYGRHKGLSPHPLFDPAFYARQLSDKTIQGKDLFLHFLHKGQQTDTDPHVCFSMGWYRARYEKRDELHPWVDYLRHARESGREPNWLFSHNTVSKLFDLASDAQRSPLEIYLSKYSGSAQSPHPLLDLSLVLRHNKDIDASKPYQTFWEAYRSREIRTHLYFDPRYYLGQIRDRSSRIRALADYVLQGENDGLAPIPLFHPSWYREHYGRPEIHNSSLEEFIDVGEKLQRHPCPGFDPRYYLERHPDVARAGQAPLRHFITAGQREGRRPHARFDLKWYAESVPSDAKEKALEYFLESGRAAGQAPHPAVSVEARGLTKDALTSFLQPNPLRSTVIPGIQTVFVGDHSASATGISPGVNGQAWLVERFEREAHAGTAFTANRAKRWEPIARQYSIFDENAAERYSQDIDAAFSKLQVTLPLVSVVMPTRNRASVLKRAIRSVLSQTHADLELIIVDDGSTDGTEKLLQGHISDPRVIYVPIQASGVSAARNEGLRNARGEYIAYLDSDNYWEPRHLEITLKAMVLNQAAAAYSTLRAFNAAGTVVYRGDVFNLDALCRENYIDMNVYIHHRRFVDAGLHFDESLRRCVDWDLILRISKVEAPLYVPVIGCNYVDDNDSLERITTNELSGDFYRVCQTNINLEPHIVGTAPAGECAFTVIWPISNADWSSVTDDLWAVVQHVAVSGHELIIVNNGLTYAATNVLNALARYTRHVRVINLWRTFLDYPAANLAASIARGRHLLVWRSGTRYDASAIDDLVDLGTRQRSPVVVPLVVDSRNVVVSELARLDYTSTVLSPTLTGQSNLPATGQIHGIVPVTSPALIHAQTLRDLGGFDAAFAVTYGLADFAARLLVEDPHATTVCLGVRLHADKKPASASSENEYLKELDALKERWLGKVRIDPLLPDGLTLRDARKRPMSVVKWNLLPDAHSGSALVAPSVSRPLVFALRCPAPNSPERDSWGDYHYAQSIIAALEDFGHSGVIEFRDDWAEDRSAGDVVLHLRGIVDVKPVRSALNAMWVISHPDKIRPEEYAAMDAVFAAGAQLKAHLWQALGVDSHLLLQATDPSRFSADAVAPVDALRGKALFVGNSRLQPRTIVLDAIQQRLPLVVYGKDWDHFLPAHLVQGEHIQNEELGNWYGSAAVVLNDHWPTMREYGIISNRIFDVVATGRPVITDFVEGLDPIFGDAVRTYHDSTELPGLVDNLRGFDGSKVSRHIREKHSFKARTADILSYLNISKR